MRSIPSTATGRLDAALLATAGALAAVTVLLELQASRTLLPSNPAAETVMATAIAGATALLAALAWLRYRALRDDALRLESGAFAALALVTLYFLLVGIAQGTPPPEEHSSLAAHVAFAVTYLGMGVLLLAAAAASTRPVGAWWPRAAAGAGPALFAGLSIAGLASPGVWVSGELGSGTHTEVPSDALAIALHLPAAAIFVAGTLAYRHLFRTRGQPADGALSYALLVGVFSQVPLPIKAGPEYAAGITADELARLGIAVIVLAGTILQVGSDARHLARADRDLQRLHQAELERKALADRERLAREIHDGIAQDLWLAKLTYGQLRTILPQRPDLDELGALVDDVLDEAVAGTRQAIAWTQGAAVSATPFSDALARMAREMSNRFDAEISVETGAVPALEPRVEIELLRISQEALRNAVKHARASTISVALHAVDSRLTIAIEDDGMGFDEATVPPGAFGLQTMRRRAELIGGRLTLRTARAGGTHVEVELPLDGVAAPERRARATDGAVAASRPTETTGRTASPPRAAPVADA